MPYFFHQLLYLFHIVLVDIAGFHDPLPDHVYISADCGELSVIFPKLVIVAIIGVVVKYHVTDILQSAQHSGSLDFVIKDIFLVIAEEHFQLICALTHATHQLHFLSDIAASGGSVFWQNSSILTDCIWIGFAFTGVRGRSPLQAHLLSFCR